MIFKLEEALIVVLPEVICVQVRELMRQHLECENEFTFTMSGEYPRMQDAANLILKKCRYLTIDGVSAILDVFREEIKNEPQPILLAVLSAQMQEKAKHPQQKGKGK